MICHHSQCSMHRCSSKTSISTVGDRFWLRKPLGIKTTTLYVRCRVMSQKDSRLVTKSALSQLLYIEEHCYVMAHETSLYTLWSFCKCAQKNMFSYVCRCWSLEERYNQNGLSKITNVDIEKYKVCIYFFLQIYILPELRSTPVATNFLKYITTQWS